MELLAKKALSTDTNGFNETVEFTVLMCSNVEGNNNKFFCAEIQKKNDQYRIFTHYGRLGKTNTYDIRDETRDGKPLSYDIVKKEYDSLLSKKQKGKKKDGYVEKYERVETFSPTVGSPNIRNKSSQIEIKTDLNIIKTEYSNIDTEVSRIVNQVCEENIHNITETIDAVLTSNGFETPLGPVTIQQIEKARKPLLELKDVLENSDSDRVKKLNTLFFSLIPHKFGSKISESDLITDNEKLISKFDLLETLESAVKMGDSLGKSTDVRYKALGVEISLLKDSFEIERIIDYVINSRADNHKGTRVYNIKVKNIFEVKIPFERENFISKGLPIGNIKELFHGSRNCNILSILKNSLMIFKNHPTKAGDMFGPGIYFADNSTKSANYSIGYWSRSTKQLFNNYFMFIGDVALGNIKEEFFSKSSYRNAPNGYHSVKGCKGQSLYNNEFIIYEQYQQTLKYLIEFTI